MRQYLLIALICALKVCVLVEGLYQLEVQLYGYDNPTGRCEGCTESGNGPRGCCDNFAMTTCSGDLLCDSFFNYCLQNLGSGQAECSYPGSKNSTFNTNDGAIDFSQSTMLGLLNPVILPGLTDDYHGVQLHIEIVDDDSDFRTDGTTNDDELVDTFQIGYNLSVGQRSPRQNYTGIYGFATIDLSISARCAQNFWGLDCTECFPGFTGMLCDVDVDECAGVNCSGNGRCMDSVASFSCSCNEGYSGALCQIKESTSDLNEAQSNSAILGAVIGAILSLLLIIILVVIVAVILVVRYKKHQLCFKGQIGTRSEDTPETSTAPAERYVMTAAADRDMPIYGNDIYGKQEPPDHEFNNPIYSYEVEAYNENAAPAGSTEQLFLSHYANVDNGQNNNVYANLDNSERDSRPIMSDGGHLYGNVDAVQ